MGVIIGLILVVQGVGGLINNVTGGSKSWFVLNYLELPLWLRITAHALMLTAGLLVVLRLKGWQWLTSDRD